MGDSERASDEDEPVDEHDLDVAAHLANVDSGAGCAEIWEYLSERRENAASREE